MTWFIALMISVSTLGPPVSARHDANFCNHDVVCGIGDCWEGYCEEDRCQAYWTCV